jgi:hypothetical protein
MRRTARYPLQKVRRGGVDAASAQSPSKHLSMKIEVVGRHEGRTNLSALNSRI